MTREEAKMIAEEYYKLTHQDELIGVEELCKITGYSRQTIYNNREKYPHVYVGKFLKFNRAETLELMMGRR